MTPAAKPRILITLPNLSGGGAERVITYLAKSIDADQFDVQILAQEKVGAWRDELDGLKVDFANDRPYRRIDLLRSLWATIQHARKADLVIGGNEGRATFVGLLAAKLTGKPFVAWIHNNWMQFKEVVSWRQILSLKSCTNFADRIVVCSGGAGAGLEQLIGKRPIKVIHNGVPVQTIQEQAEAPLPTEFESLFEQPTVVAVGRLNYQKGYNYLVAAHAEVIRAGIHHNLVIVGQGDLEAELHQQAVDLGVEQTVHFVGFHPNPYSFMKRATVFALSSRFEGFPLVLIEAMACGAPIVAFDCPSGPREALEDGKHGILVEYENVSALAQGIQQILTDKAQQAHFKQMSLARSETFDNSHFARKWESLFTEVLSQSKRERRSPVPPASPLSKRFEN
jgi:glycosyltransferase involved in cell wall biosynthesis